MRTPFALGQRVRFTKKCVLAPNVPKNSLGYSHAALTLKDDDGYSGEAVIQPGTLAIVVNYAAQGTASADPVVRVKGRLARVHPNHLELA